MNLTFESERILFRPLTEDDLDIEIELWTDPDVARFITGKAATEDEVAAQMATVTRRGGGGCIGIWCLIDRSSHQKLGHAVLLPLPVEEEDTDWNLLNGDDIPDGDIEIGYVLKKAAWGKGYATEACKRLLQFAFEETQLDEIVATTDPDNTASQRVLEKSGLIYQGLVRAFASDVPGFKITRHQW